MEGSLPPYVESPVSCLASLLLRMPGICHLERFSLASVTGMIGGGLLKGISWETVRTERWLSVVKWTSTVLDAIADRFKNLGCGWQCSQTMSSLAVARLLVSALRNKLSDRRRRAPTDFPAAVRSIRQSDDRSFNHDLLDTRGS